MMIEVPLSRGLVAIIDDADGPAVLAAGKWSADVHDHTTYARRSYVRTDRKRGWQRLHSFLTGWPLVDHVNGDGLDCRRINMRSGTQSQNLANRSASRNNTSGYKGVSFDRSRGSYQALIGVRGQRIALGRYADPIEAARAYDEAARHHFGEFARLNFPEEIR